MKLMAIAILATGTAYAAHSHRSEELTVYVDGAATVPLKNLAPALGLVSEMFRQIGVRVAISSRKPSDWTPARNRMTVRITTHCNAPARDAVAYAYPFEGSTIVVCYDRLAWSDLLLSRHWDRTAFYELCCFGSTEHKQCGAHRATG